MITFSRLRRPLSPEALAAAGARGLTRRRLLGSAGGIALGAGLATASLTARNASACTSASPCGPSPLCGASRCNAGEHDQCDYDEGGVEKARWDSGVQPCRHLEGRNVNCWTENGTWCCDCCVLNAGCTTGSRCSTKATDSSSACDSGIWHKCICNGRLV
jgi:hypothetical protein